MTRFLFVSDPLLSSLAGVAQLPANQPYQLFTDRQGGSVVTDVVSPDGSTAIANTGGWFTADGSGQPNDFRGPNDTVCLWVDGSAGHRYPIFAVDLLAQILAGNISGTSATAAAQAAQAAATAAQDAATGAQTAAQAAAAAAAAKSGFTIKAARLASDAVLTDAQALALYGEGSYFTVDQVAGTSGGGTTTPDAIAPTAPVLNNPTAVTTTSFNVSWSASTDAVGVTGYEVQVNGAVYTTGTGLSATVTGRTPGTTYTVRVRARDAAGNWSALSNTVPATTLATTTEVVTVRNTVPLGAAAEWSSNPIATAGYPKIRFRVIADQTFTTRLDTSTDGVTFTNGTPVYTPAASSGTYTAAANYSVGAAYVRLTVICGGTGMTSIEAATITGSTDTTTVGTSA